MLQRHDDVTQELFTSQVKSQLQIVWTSICFVTFPRSFCMNMLWMLFVSFSFKFSTIHLKRYQVSNFKWRSMEWPSKNKEIIKLYGAHLLLRTTIELHIFIPRVHLPYQAKLTVHLTNNTENIYFSSHILNFILYSNSTYTL